MQVDGAAAHVNHDWRVAGPWGRRCTRDRCGSLGCDDDNLAGKAACKCLFKCAVAAAREHGESDGTSLTEA